MHFLLLPPNSKNPIQVPEHDGTLTQKLINALLQTGAATKK